MGRFVLANGVNGFNFDYYPILNREIRDALSYDMAVIYIWKGRLLGAADPVFPEVENESILARLLSQARTEFTM